MIAIFITSLFLAHVQLSSQDTITSVTLKEVDNDSGTIPINLSFKQCGGPAKLIIYRNSLCKDSSIDACKAPGYSKDEITFETYFVPSKDLEKLSYRVTLTFGGKDPVVDHDAEVSGSAKKGKLAQLVGKASARADFAAGKLTVKYELIDPTDKSVELCVEDNYEFA